MEAGWKVHGAGKAPEVGMRRDGAALDLMLHIETKSIKEMVECLSQFLAPS